MLPDRDLDRELRDLGHRVEYPTTPDLAQSVRGRLEAEDGTAESSARTRPHLWWIAAAALALLVAVPVFSLAIRDTVGGVSSGAGGGAAVESGGQGVGDAGPTRPAEEGGSLAAGAGGGEPPSTAAESGGSAASAEAACGWGEPILQARPARGAPGEEFGIRGRNFEADVWDCDENPARDARLQFLQDGRTWELGSVDASTGGSRLAAQLEVPAGARPGRATVRVTYEQRSPEGPRRETSIEARFFVTG